MAAPRNKFRDGIFQFDFTTCLKEEHGQLASQQTTIAFQLHPDLKHAVQTICPGGCVTAQKTGKFPGFGDEKISI